MRSIIHKVTLVQLSFDFYIVAARPEYLIGDRAYDSDGPDDELKHDGVNLIAPHQSTYDLKTPGGPLPKYQRRWLVGRFIVWLHWKRRLHCAREYYNTSFLNFVQPPCTMFLKRF